MGMTNFEFFAIVVFGMAILGALAWRQIKRTRDEAEARMESYEEAARRNAAKLKKYALDKAYAADRYNEAASMEPFCGEGKKP